MQHISIDFLQHCTTCRPNNSSYICWIQLSNCMLSYVTQMAYQLSVSLYQDQLVCKMIYSVYRAFSNFTLCRQLLLSFQGQQRKFNVYQALMVSEENSILIKFTRQSKDFTVLTQFRWLTREIVSKAVFIKQGRLVKEFVNL